MNCNQYTQNALNLSWFSAIRILVELLRLNRNDRNVPHNVWTLGPQMVTLFGEVVELLWGGSYWRKWVLGGRSWDPCLEPGSCCLSVSWSAETWWTNAHRFLLPHLPSFNQESKSFLHWLLLLISLLISFLWPEMLLTQRLSLNDGL